MLLLFGFILYLELRSFIFIARNCYHKNINIPEPR